MSWLGFCISGGTNKKTDACYVHSYNTSLSFFFGAPKVGPRLIVREAPKVGGASWKTEIALTTSANGILLFTKFRSGCRNGLGNECFWRVAN